MTQFHQKGFIATLLKLASFGFVLAILITGLGKYIFEQKQHESLQADSLQYLNQAAFLYKKFEKQAEQGIKSFVASPNKAVTASTIFTLLPQVTQLQVITPNSKQGIGYVKVESNYEIKQAVTDVNSSFKATGLFRLASNLGNNEIWFSSLRSPKLLVSGSHYDTPIIFAVQPLNSNNNTAKEGGDNNSKLLLATIKLETWLDKLAYDEKFDFYLADKTGELYFSAEKDQSTQLSFEKRFDLSINEALINEQNPFLIKSASVVIPDSHDFYVIVAPNMTYQAVLDSQLMLFTIGVFAILSMALVPLVIWTAYHSKKTVQQHEEFHERIKQYSNIVDGHVPILETNLSGGIVRCNEAMCYLSGYAHAELIGKNVAIFRHPDVDEVIYGQMWRTLAHGQPWSGEFHNQTKLGNDFWLKADVIPIKHDGERISGYISIASDITDRKRLERHSATDSLTDIGNRAKLEKVLEEEHQRARRYCNQFSILLIDVDHFKLVNDRFGHLTGDAVLKALAKLVKDNIRTTDCVGRWGGEEFMIICRETGLESAVHLANKLSKLIASHDFKLVGQVTASIGVAEFERFSSIHELIQIADTYLYQAKAQGRDQVVSAMQPEQVKLEILEALPDQSVISDTRECTGSNKYLVELSH